MVNKDGYNDGTARTVDGALVSGGLHVAVGRNLDHGVLSDVVQLCELLSSGVGDVQAASLLAVLAVSRPSTSTTFQLAATRVGDCSLSVMTSMSAQHNDTAANGQTPTPFLSLIILLKFLLCLFFFCLFFFVCICYHLR